MRCSGTIGKILERTGPKLYKAAVKAATTFSFSKGGDKYTFVQETTAIFQNSLMHY